ncbi:MAG: DUF134 domain-containing protein [Brevinematales bacterium]
MPRPKKCRHIHCKPCISGFKPIGRPSHTLEKIILKIDEFEAIRLADLEDLYHEEAARQMGISRPTFGNILTRAHQKIADAIINGKLLVIEGHETNTPWPE